MPKRAITPLSFDASDEGQDFDAYFHPVTGEPLNIKKVLVYRSLATLRKFHSCKDYIRAIIGPVGSGKTAGVAVEVGYRLPMYWWNVYGINKQRWIVIRNTYPMLIDSTQKTFFEWWPPGIYGEYNKNEKVYRLTYTTLDARDEPVTIENEILFRSCDRPEEVDKFRGYELSGYYIDEADEVHIDIKNVLKQRIGRFPPMSVWYPKLRKRFHDLRELDNKQINDRIKDDPNRFQMAFGIETSNPPPTDNHMYHLFNWQTHVPGPKPEKKPLAFHAGFWQPERENETNLRPGYYDQMAEAYAYAPDWVDRYIKGLPGLRLKGKMVYNNFSRRIHEAQARLIWKEGEILYRGWDNTGLHPACVIVQSPTPRQVQVIKEFWTERENIVSFAKRVIAICNKDYPNAEWVDYADPAGWSQFSTRKGDLTSNSEMMIEECNLALEKSEQNFKARVNAVDEQLMEMVAGGEPAFLVDPDCVGVINGFLGGYFYPRIASSTSGEELYAEQPVKNKYSDIHDALQYILVKIRSSSPKHKWKGRGKFGRPVDPLLIS